MVGLLLPSIRKWGRAQESISYSELPSEEPAVFFHLAWRGGGGIRIPSFAI